MKCAKCSGNMKTFIHAGIEIDQCENCGGIWFDPGEYEKMLKVSDIEKLKKSNPNTQLDEKRAKCPRCNNQKEMIQIETLNPSIHIDRCQKCNGMWLDGGEFEELQLDEVMDKIEKLF